MSHQADTFLLGTAARDKLEFDKIIDRLCSLTSSDLGKNAARQIVPHTDRTLILFELQQVSQAKELLIAEGSVPFDGVKDIAPALRRTRIENHLLTASELLDIASTLRAARTLHTFLAKRKSTYPTLASFLSRLWFDKVVEFNITQAIDEGGAVRDSASKELKSIRRDIAETGELLRKQLSAILRTVSEQEFVQEEIITTRDGRMVIPVKVEHKKHVPGFIHTTSASGATVYIEPAECLDLNNALRELHVREQREIERILGELTRQVRDIALPLQQTLMALAELDLLVAKAKYSIEIIGSAPQISEKHSLRLIQARHPVLLQKHRRDEVVPLDLELGGETVTLVITGPNAGGKSVAMKTVGILVLCVQSGLHIPAAPESELPVFHAVYVDIGDDQSIEHDLSTFSSHLVRLKEITERANERSLVLIDEIGAGTDPAEGAALGAAILRTLTMRGALTIATTHHGTLKAFAHESPGMANGSLEFDQETLRPTYRFRLGVPGSSYALELAHRLGLAPSLLAEAREFLGSETTKLESLIAELERQTQAYRQEIQNASKERERLQALVEAYEKKMAEVKKEVTEVRQKAMLEAQELLRSTKQTIERTVREIRESRAQADQLQEARNELRGIEQEIHKELEHMVQENGQVNIALGDRVRLRGASEVGEVVEIRTDEAIVVWRNGTLRVPLAKLIKDESSAVQTAPVVFSQYAPESKTEIDLRGMLGDEAVEAVQRFLDDALVTGFHRVTIIHGKGTGALRRRVEEFLKHYPHVASFRLGEWNEGGSGVTVVELE
jgi:DNA mismatch repair protein MutS2